MSEKRACIIAIGNELLLGQVQDTNTHWLCKQITERGGRVERIVTLRDQHEAIIAEIQYALKENFSLILTSGGLGPTPDDLTLAAMAKALGQKLTLNAEAYAMVSERIQKLYDGRLIQDASMTPSREKMAWLPAKGVPLANQVGTAPGVLLKERESTLVSLPGVPSELKDIFSNALRSVLDALFGASFYLEEALVLHWNDESALAPMLEEVQRRWPHVYVKSRTRGFEENFQIMITLSMSGERERVSQEISDARHFLCECLTQQKITFTKNTKLSNSPPLLAD
jgi:molybdenum cofactor synthesis domain-containing protein